MNTNNSVMALATTFADRGDWTVEQQFVLQMGSSYLLDGIDESGNITAQAKEQVEALLKQSFRPEFLNRLDEIVFYKPLTKAEIGKIVDLLLAKLSGRLADQQLKLDVTDAAKDFIVEHGYDPVYGARPLKRFIQSRVETLIGRMIIGSELKAGETLRVDVADGRLVCTAEAAK